MNIKHTEKSGAAAGGGAWLGGLCCLFPFGWIAWSYRVPIWQDFEDGAWKPILAVAVMVVGLLLLLWKDDPSEQPH
jgi:hypothetical protein